MKPEQTMWTLLEAAEYLGMSEKALLRMAQQAHIPAVRIGDEWHFLPERLSQWMEDQSGAPDSLRHLLRLDPLAVPLDRVVSEQDILIVPEIGSKHELFVRLADQLARRYPTVEVDRYVAGIEEREDLSPTVVGPGVAVPHVRDISANPARSLNLIVGILQRPLPYDHDNVWCAVLICADDLVLHLRLLQKLSYLFADTQRARSLQNAPTSGAALQILMDLERTRRR